MDQIDRRILEELQHDGSLSNVALARRVGLYDVAARMDDRYELVAGALSANPERARASAACAPATASMKASIWPRRPPS